MKLEKDYKNRIMIVLLWIKIIFWAVLFFIIEKKMGYTYALLSLIEVLVLFFICNSISNKIMRYAINVIGSILLGTQLLILVFGRTYLTLVMLTNLDSIEDLSGNGFLYITSAVLLVVISLLPVKKLSCKKISFPVILSWILGIELILVMCLGNSYSPFYGYLNLIQQQKNQKELERNIETLKTSAGEFYRSGIENYYGKPNDLVEKPNVVILFTEGLSQCIIDDEREIMPNVRNYQRNSLVFEQYFNHTFATYRGLIGQLYSGYQLNNYDSNQFVSLQDIFSGEGYTTTFINTEPANAPFTSYLDKFKFDFLEGELNEINGPANSISDRSAYEKLYDLMAERNNDGQPYMIAMYTFGTHASLDSVDEVYGNGEDAEINKFYNVDVQFGKFMEKFEKSDMAQNTIIVFSADHCTYGDDGFYKSFPDYERLSEEVDEIPFFIYYQGIQPQIIDAGGRNSLDFAPTICDYLDFSAENYFLGFSLFSSIENNTTYDTVFNQGQDYFSTRGGKVSEMSDVEKEIASQQIAKYLSVSRKVE